MNTLRNEQDIELCGETRTMRATFDALCAIERDLRTNLVPLIARLGNGDLGVNQAALVIYHGLRGYGDESLTLNQIGEMVMKTGLSKIMDPVVAFLSKAMEGQQLGKSQAEEAV